MRKVLKVLGIVLGVIALAVGGFVAWAYRQSLEPEVDFEWKRNFSDRRILFEWHYPATRGAPAYVEVCYIAEFGIQCYRIEGNHVIDYHHFKVSEKFNPNLEMMTWNFSEQVSRLTKAIRDAQSSSQSSRWYWVSPFTVQSPRHVPKMTYDSDDNEGTILSCIISNMVSQMRLYETNNVGYVSMIRWHIPDAWEATAYPLDEAPPVFKALREVFEECMADLSGCEYHTSYIRGYPIPPPEKPHRVPVLDARKTSQDFGARQRDVVQFLMEMSRVLIPIEKGVNPFRKFWVPYAPGKSLVVNYRNENEDTVLFLHGDNFWRIQVYGGEEPAPHSRN